MADQGPLFQSLRNADQGLGVSGKGRYEMVTWICFGSGMCVNGEGDRLALMVKGTGGWLYLRFLSCCENP